MEQSFILQFLVALILGLCYPSIHDDGVSADSKPLTARCLRGLVALQIGYRMFCSLRSVVV